jgi:hypothetical protein
MKKLDMADYVPTEVDVPEIGIEFCNVAVIPEGHAEESINRLKEEIRKTDPEFIKRLEKLEEF